MEFAADMEGERALVNGDHPRQTARNVSRPQSRGEQPTATSSGGAEPVSRPVKDARKLNGDASHPSQVSTLDMPTTSDSGIPSLDGVPREVQEAWICEDMMFVLQVRVSAFCRSSVRASRGL